MLSDIHKIDVPTLAKLASRRDEIERAITDVVDAVFAALSEESK